MNLYSWSGGRWQPILPCAKCQLDTKANHIEVELDHFTDFALGVHKVTSAQPVSVTLTPEADSYILSSTPAVNYGKASTLYVGTQKPDMTGRALFRFRLSAIPIGVTVLNASFQARLVQDSPSPTLLPVELRRADAPWQEKTVAWRSPVPTTGNKNVTGMGTASNYHQWNVTSLVQAWINGAPNHGH